MRKFIIILFILLTIASIPLQTFATVTDDAVKDGDSFIGNAKDSGEVFDMGELKNLSNDIYNMLLIMGIVIAVIVGSILGIKFMISSVEEQAKIKNVLIIYVIGCIVVFGAFTIWKIVANLLASA